MKRSLDGLLLFIMKNSDFRTSHRHSIRFAGYDYTQPGAYFVTLVTHGHNCVFGKIVNQEIHLYDLGKIVDKCWREIPNHFINVEVDPFIVMPNHLHGIITIYEDDRRGTIYRAPTMDLPDPTSQNNSPSLEKFGNTVIGSIPTIIRTYKAAVSRTARRELGMANIWQRNYYEHIVRNENELNNITAYISANRQTWIDDPENQD